MPVEITIDSSKLKKIATDVEQSLVRRLSADDTVTLRRKKMEDGSFAVERFVPMFVLKVTDADGTFFGVHDDEAELADGWYTKTFNTRAKAEKFAAKFGWVEVEEELWEACQDISFN